jgi:hypothetical protein
MPIRRLEKGLSPSDGDIRLGQKSNMKIGSLRATLGTVILSALICSSVQKARNHVSASVDIDYCIV